MLEIYYYDITKISDEEFMDMYAGSDGKRREKADKIKNDKGKKLSIAAGELTRRIVAKKFGIKTEDIRFRTGEKGKPYIENLDIEFSISHSGNIAICAISDKPVGIDIEKIRDINIGIAKKLFTIDEQKYIFEKWNLSKERFLEVWTRKEAYVKMLGKGISYFPNFSTMGDKRIETHVRDRYIVSVVKETSE